MLESYFVRLRRRGIHNLNEQEKTIKNSNRKYAFLSGSRYLTRGIRNKVPLQIQFILWALINELVNSSTNCDYLQIFTFKIENDELIITHKQEEPEYEVEYHVKLIDDYKILASIKIYIIDDETHSTMLLAEEY